MWKQLAVGISAPLRQLGTGSRTPDVLLGTSASPCDRTQKDLVSVFPFLHSLLWIQKYSYQCHCFQHWERPSESYVLFTQWQENLPPPAYKLLFSGVADPFRKNVHFFMSQFQFFQRAIPNCKFWCINHPSPQLDWALHLAAPGVIKLLSHLRPRAPYRSNMFVKFSVSLSPA